MNAPATLRKNVELRVLGVAVVGVLAVAGVVAFASARSLGYRVTPLSVLGTLVYFGLIWVLPAGLPPAALGAFLSMRVMHREPAGRPLWFWSWRAVATGAPLGAAGTALLFVFMFVTEPDHLRRVIGPVTAIGAGAGAGVGLIVGLYCWQQTRRIA